MKSLTGFSLFWNVLEGWKLPFLMQFLSICSLYRELKDILKSLYRFVAYSSVKEAEEAITKYDHFRFGRDSELRVQLSHEKEKGFGFGFIPQNIDIQLGPASNSKINDNADSGTDSIEKLVFSYYYYYINKIKQPCGCKSAA